MRIGPKLFVFAVLCSVIPLLAAFTLSFSAANKSLRKSAEQNLLADAVEELDSLQQNLQQAKRHLATLGTLSNLQETDSAFSYSLQADIERYSKRTPLYAEILATNAEGMVVAASLKQSLNTDLSNTWEFEAPRLGIEFDGRVVQSYRLNRKIATQSVPIYSYMNNELIGTLIGSIDWDYLHKDLSTHSILGGEQGQQRQVFLEAVADNSILYATSGVKVPHDAMAKVTDTGVARVVSVDNHTYMMVSVDSGTTGEFRNPQWRLHVLLDTDIAYASIESLQNYFMFAAGAVLLLSLLATVVLSRSIVKPLHSLVAGAIQLSRGNYDTPLKEISKTDEIGLLTRTFNTMRVAIKQQQAELIKKTEAAETAAKVKTDFLANMSHEVRTPINGVLGMTELLLNTPLDVKQLRYTETISKSGQSLLAVINDILDFSKIEAGKLALTEVPFDLREMVEDVIDMIAESAYRNNIGFYLQMPPDFHVAYNGDVNRLRQVLLNLLGNAVKFTEEGEVRLVVSSLIGEDNIERIKFDVVDTGIGIPDAQLKSIFDSFVQADGTSTRQFGGTGLGLSISSMLAKLMGGSLSVKSELGVGSSFSFTANLEKLPVSFESVWRRKDSLVGKKVLVVDDNKTNRQILQAQLEYWGAVPELARNGIVALDMFKRACDTNDEYDAAILDMQMPGCTGVELANKVKSQSLATGTRLILLSSSSDLLHAEEYQKSGIHTFATKPIRQPDLYNCLTAAVNTLSLVEQDGRTIAKKFKQNCLSGTVLLAEDNIVNQDMMREMLTQLGVSVHVAENGQHVLDILQEKSFDVVLMDCQMPVLDGFATTKIIRENEVESNSSNRLPIIALTANAMEGYREKCLDAGMDEYLTKPVSSQALIDTVNQWLAPRHSESDSADNTNIAVMHPTNNSDTDSQAIDEETLDETVFGELFTMCEQASSGFYDSLVDTYAESAKDDIDNIRSAISANDMNKIGICAHRLKSSSANWGAKKLASICELLEIAGKAGQQENTPAMLADIESYYIELVDILNTHKSRAA